MLGFHAEQIPAQEDIKVGEALNSPNQVQNEESNNLQNELNTISEQVERGNSLFYGIGRILNPLIDRFFPTPAAPKNDGKNKDNPCLNAPSSDACRKRSQHSEIQNAIKELEELLANKVKNPVCSNDSKPGSYKRDICKGRNKIFCQAERQVYEAHTKKHPKP